MKMKWKKITLALMVILTFCASLSALANEVESRKLAIIQVEGKDAEIKKPNGRIVKAASGMSLGVDNRVTTGKGTYVYISADDDKTLKMDENSMIQIAKASEKSLSVDILNGQLFFNVEKPLKADEEMNFRVANTSMSIRGTSGWLRYDTMDMEFFLAEGSVSWDIDGQEITVNPGQRVLLERDWGGENPGPGKPLKYTISIQDDYTWEDLPKDALVAFMEHRAQMDLTAIGLDKPEEVAQAAEEVEEIEKEREEANKPVYIETDDDDDDWYPPETQPTTIATSSNAESTEESGGDLWSLLRSVVERVLYNENINGSYVDGSWEWNREQILEDNYWLYKPEAGTLYDRSNWELESVNQYDQINGSYEQETSDWSWDVEQIYEDGYWYTQPETDSLWDNINDENVWVERYDQINGTYDDEGVWNWYPEFLESNHYT